MKEAYNVGLYGNDARVLDGSWRELFSSRGKPAIKSKVIGNEDGAREDAHENRETETNKSKGKRKTQQQRTLDSHFKKAKR
jgi:cryptochrome